MMSKERDAELQRLRDDISAATAIAEETEARLAESNRQLHDALTRNNELDEALAKAKQKPPPPAPVIAEASIHPPCPESHGNRNANVFYNDIPAAFGAVFDIAPGLLMGPWREAAKECLGRHYPNLRRSALRAMLEDKVCGKMVATIPLGAKRRISCVLGFLDLCETMVADAAGK